MSLKINYYNAGENIYFKAKVIDTTGKSEQGAAVKSTITSSKGIPTVVKGITNQGGEVTFVISTYRTTIKGTYKVLSERTYSNYLGSSANISFQIR